MSSDNATAEQLNYLSNLIVLGILINTYYYFGFGGAFIAFVLAALLEPVSNVDVLGPSTEAKE
ncbi:hypothetical protein JCM30237_07290 [Halolamina litorea]|uniref:Uncharacterized protein n=1 Tax=Halolamina litorea TaxID=1515593 RepID=A0ABD6BPS8_9EURY|nr:hypothetical protein [Halolamina litorea]